MTVTDARSVAERFDPLDPGFLADPDQLFDQARRECPVFYSPLTRRWIVTRYDDVVEVLKDNERFSARGTIAMPAEQLPAARQLLGGHPYPFEVPALVNNDPPDHTRIRALVRRAFPPPLLDALAPRVQALACELIDQFVGDGRADLVAQFAQPLSIRTLAALMGLPDSRIDRLHAWTELGVQAAQPDLSTERRTACVRGVREWQAFCEHLVAERRQAPGEDLISGLVTARLDGQAPLDDHEAVAVLIQLLIAGYVTTAHFIASAVLLLLEQSGEWVSLAVDPSRVPIVIEEALRLASPLTIATRTTTRACEFAGCSLPEGARLRLMLVSANRDEARFPNPHQFDPDRTIDKRHIAFGFGIHHCVGAALARLEGRIALGQLVTRLPSARLAAGEPPRYERSVVFRGPQRLAVTWDRP
jgi:cytochrome P450